MMLAEKEELEIIVLDLEDLLFLNLKKINCGNDRTGLEKRTLELIGGAGNGTEWFS